MLGAAMLVSYAVIRSIFPDPVLLPWQRRVALAAEIVIASATVVATGYWESPFLPALLTPTMSAGLALGFGAAFAAGTALAIAVNVPLVVTGAIDDLDGGWSTIYQSATLLLLFAMVAGYAKRILGEAEREQSLALDRLGRLADANDLLYSLHQAAQSLPASLDLDEVLDSTLAQLGDLFEPDAVVILLFDETDLRFTVARRSGVRPPESLRLADLPPPLTRATETRHAIAESNLIERNGPGVGPSNSSGLYAPLRARGALLGLVALEANAPGTFDQRDVELLDGFAEPAALAIDNARWFSRLRTIGADEERTRIARDLHDRIGQSVAYLAFELDRLVKKAEHDEKLHIAISGLRNDVRGVVSELRETLYDLRTDVSEDQEFVSVVEEYLDRVRQRTQLQISFTHAVSGRLPIRQEREMWRIAQEAITNIERHADATAIAIRWECDGTSARLSVRDNGKGFPEGRAGRLDSYGMIGMRERAAAIDARLDVSSEPGQGTTVACALTPRP